jgi:hypothetical protein
MANIRPGTWKRPESWRDYNSIMDQYPDMKDWHSQMARGSELTADTKRRQLMGFCEEMEITPDKLAQMNVKDLEKLLNKYVDKKSVMVNPKSGNHYAGSYIHSRIKGVKSWLAFNDKQVKKIPVSGATLRPTLENENVPSQVEMKRIFMFTSGIQWFQNRSAGSIQGAGWPEG